MECGIWNIVSTSRFFHDVQIYRTTSTKVVRIPYSLIPHSNFLLLLLHARKTVY